MIFSLELKSSTYQKIGWTNTLFTICIFIRIVHIEMRKYIHIIIHEHFYLIHTVRV